MAETGTTPSVVTTVRVPGLAYDLVETNHSELPYVEDKASADGGVPAAIIWLPYFILIACIAGLLTASFVRFHHRNGWKYYIRRRGGIIDLSDEKTLKVIRKSPSFVNHGPRLKMQYHKVSDVSSVVMQSLLEGRQRPVPLEKSRIFQIGSACGSKDCSRDSLLEHPKGNGAYERRNTYDSHECPKVHRWAERRHSHDVEARGYPSTGLSHVHAHTSIGLSDVSC